MINFGVELIAQIHSGVGVYESQQGVTSFLQILELNLDIHVCDLEVLADDVVFLLFLTSTR